MEGRDRLISEFEASLVYKVSSIQRNPVLKKAKNKQTNKQNPKTKQTAKQTNKQTRILKTIYFLVLALCQI
jgi:nicotinic acid phosphoribosyltransferase